MENITVTFGKRVRNLRTNKKLSQERLAELSGLHATYIGQIERGEKSPTLESIYKLSKGLQISLEELFKNMAGENSETIYADEIYNEMLTLPQEKQKKVLQMIQQMMTFSD